MAYLGAHRLVLHVVIQDSQAALDVRHRHGNVAVKAARAGQGGVQGLREVRRGHDDDPLVCLGAHKRTEEQT